MDFITSTYFTYQSYFNFALFLVGTVVAAHLVTFIFGQVLSRLAARTKTKLDDRLVVMIEPPVYWGVILGGLYLALRELTVLAAYQNTIAIVTKIAFILILLVVTIKTSKAFFGWFREERELKKRQISFLLTIQKLVNATIYFVGLIFILQALGISISPLVASLGIGGLAVGLALQPTLSNYFSGLYLSADGFIKPDDYIELESGMKGYVVKVGWRNTIIKLWNNNLVMIPNARLADSRIVNYNEPSNPHLFIVTCGVAYWSDLKRVEKLALEIAKKIQKKKKHGAPKFNPLFRYYNFGDSNIDFKLILQADKFSSHFLMAHELIRELKAAFDKAGIAISFPMRTLEFHQPLEMQCKDLKTPSK